ncbi:zinc knuckle CX2CX4HX4C containing protein [Tanacetum coccineum]
MQRGILDSGGSKHTKNVDRLSETGTYKEGGSNCPRVEDLVAKISNIIKRQMLEADGNVLANDNVKKGVVEPSLKLTHTSLASLVSDEACNHKVHFRSLDTGKPTNELVPSVLGFEVHALFEYILYVYFMGKRVVSLVVENYVRNAWKIYGIVHAMMNANDLFFFNFSSARGMNGVLDNGPLFILSIPIILEKWTPNARRLNYARALIDIRVDRELKETMAIDVPCLEGDRDVSHTLRVEYEWNPPRCGVCMASSTPNMASIVELMVNSSSNDNKAGKSSVQANEYSESDVEDI